ncbi:MAG TPA: RagB/SusD family nutrient uptake outer membrane protein, partial [Algoriphagus sp.]|nr:RagB/SusD family nutrient uptake outer membrane protein [Algoriphagus sp.]
MKNNIKNIAKMIAVAGLITACNPLQLDDIQDPNNPSIGSISNNASRE